MPESVASKLASAISLTSQIADFPSALVKAWFGPQEEYWLRRVRVQKLKEAAEIQEILKLLNYILIWKGDFRRFAESLDRDPHPDAIGWIKETCAEAANVLEAVRQDVADSCLSDPVLAATAISFLSEAVQIYTEISNASNQALAASGRLGELSEALFQVQENANKVLVQLIEHRHKLDHSYG